MNRGIWTAAVVIGVAVFSLSAPIANGAELSDGYWTKVRFNEAWGKRLHGFKTLAQLQRAAGSAGRVREEADGRKYVSWASEPPSHTGGGWMLATIMPDGYIGVGITLIDGPSMVLNNCGGIICDDCVPPIDVPGCRPPTSR